MKKIAIIVLCLGIFLSCDKDEVPEILRAQEYGIQVVDLNGEEIQYSYMFYDLVTGSVYNSGSSSNKQVMFSVGNNMDGKDYVNVEVYVENPIFTKVYYISKSNGLYLNWEDSPAAENVFEINPVNFVDEIEAFEDAIPLEFDKSRWIKNN